MMSAGRRGEAPFPHRQWARSMPPSKGLFCFQPCPRLVLEIVLRISIHFLKHRLATFLFITSRILILQTNSGISFFKKKKKGLLGLKVVGIYLIKWNVLWLIIKGLVYHMEEIIVVETRIKPCSQVGKCPEKLDSIPLWIKPSCKEMSKRQSRKTIKNLKTSMFLNERINHAKLEKVLK